MPYETDHKVLAWFGRALSHTQPRVRREALGLLEHVDCAQRMHWLLDADRDEDPDVRALAQMIVATEPCRREREALELLESELVSEGAASDLQWEWEYAFKVCRDLWVPPSIVLAWTREEDDQTARQIALLKAAGGGGVPDDAVAVLIDKRLVTLYTRSPRSFAEAVLWHHKGRPRYQDG